MRRKKIKFCVICGKNLNNIEGLKLQRKTCCEEHKRILRRAYWRDWWKNNPDKKYFKDRKPTGFRINQRKEVKIRKKRTLERNKYIEKAKMEEKFNNTLPTEDNVIKRAF